MPLRDHFHAPLDKVASWEGFHGGWPMVIVQHLRKVLPPGYVAEPRVHSGSQIEIDVATFETANESAYLTRERDKGGVATVVWTPARPTLAVETTLPVYDEYQVRIFDLNRGRHLVAAIEIVSPANKDRPEHCNIFVAKCAALLQKGVAISIVDLVTVRSVNLYFELLNFIGHADPTFSDTSPALYAASCRWTLRENRTILETWSDGLRIGEPLPTLPLWLRADLSVPLNLESSYEQTCSDLWIV